MKPSFYKVMGHGELLALRVNKGLKDFRESRGQLG
jgi:hypothetical protein